MGKWRCRGCQEEVEEVRWLLQWPICLKCAGYWDEWKAENKGRFKDDEFRNIKLLFEFLRFRNREG